METELDEGLYSRQMYTLGKDAMKQICQKKILISGMNGLGLEVAKNVILAGVHQVDLHDNQLVTWMDLSSMFYGCQDSSCIGSSRLDAVYSSLCELNEYVKVRKQSGELTQDLIQEFDVVCLTDSKSNEEICRINDICRKLDKIFIMGTSRGLCGRIFCDFGAEYVVKDVTGTKPQSHPILSISKVKLNEFNKEREVGLVEVQTEKGHQFCDESIVKFAGVQGMTELNDLEPFMISIDDHKKFYVEKISNYHDYIPETGTVTEVFLPKTINCSPFSEFLECYPDYNLIEQNCCSPMKRLHTLHLCFICYDKFYEKYNRLPEPWSESDSDILIGIIETHSSDLDISIIEWDIVRLFCYSSRGILNPIHATLAGIIGQEILKAASHQFTPIHQFYFCDFLECLPENYQDECLKDNSQFQPLNCRYDGQIVVFGKEFQKRLASANIFVIGAGAIGCEMLKNLSMMGVSDTQWCDGVTGKVLVTDMDHIERSNLNRQFLFRNSDIGQPKSVRAAEAVKRMNPAVNIEAHTNQLCKDTEQIYTNSLFSEKSCVLNALDNVDARVYVASRVLMNLCPLIDSGTLGTQASQQVILPGLTKNYSGRQGAEESIPICTIKNFPYQIEHTIQWSKDLFNSLFTSTPRLAEIFMQNKSEFFEQMNQLSGYQKFDSISQVMKFLTQRPNSFEDCVEWAIDQWIQMFSFNIQQLIHLFPENHKTTEGLPFWVGNKKFPVFEQFSIDNNDHLNFVVTAANLRNRIFNLPATPHDESQRKKIIQLIQSYKYPEFVPTSENIAVDDSELENMLDQDLLNQRIQLLKNMEITEALSVSSEEFEKDDDTNFHIDFITAASNNRAFNYLIKPVDRFKTKQIAGRIIPAIATSTCTITGQVCLELYKIIQGHKNIRRFRDAYLNLSCPQFTFTIPQAARKYKLLGKEYNIWDKFHVKGDITLQEFIDVMKNQHEIDIYTVMFNNAVVYSKWFVEYTKECLNVQITKIITEKLNLSIASNETVIALSVGVEDDEGNDIENVPLVRYEF